MVCRCSQMRWGSSFLEGYGELDQRRPFCIPVHPVPGTVWTVWLPTKCGTGSKDCSKVRLKCWMVLGYTFYKTRLYMNVVSQNLYMPSVLKSCLRKLTSFPLFPSLHGDDGHVTATAEPLHGPSSERLAADTLCSLWSQVPRQREESDRSSITTDKTQKNG